VIFYQVLAGQRPFEGKAPVEYIAAHLNAVAPPVAAPSDAPSLPVPLVRLVGQMLEKRREDRPANWREIVDRLVAVLRAGGATRLPPGLERMPPGEGAIEATRGTEIVGVSPDDSTRFPGTSRPLHETRLLAWLAAAGVLLVVSVSWWAARVQPSARPVDHRAAEPEPTAVVAGPESVAFSPTPVVLLAGRLQILGLPFARVVSLVDAGSGNSVPLPANATTPLLVTDLAPGRYRVVLLGPGPEGRTVERDVSVASGATVLLSEPFATPGALADSLTTGESR
jgi:hypothetical protein